MQVSSLAGPVCPAARAIGRTVKREKVAGDLTEPATAPSIPRQLVFAVRMCEAGQGSSTNIACVLTGYHDSQRKSCGSRSEAEVSTKRGAGFSLCVGCAKDSCKARRLRICAVWMQAKMQLPCTRVRPLREGELQKGWYGI